MKKVYTEGKLNVYAQYDKSLDAILFTLKEGGFPHFFEKKVDKKYVRIYEGHPRKVNHSITEGYGRSIDIVWVEKDYYEAVGIAKEMVTAYKTKLSKTLTERIYETK